MPIYVTNQEKLCAISQRRSSVCLLFVNHCYQIILKASKYGQSGVGSSASLVLTDEEKAMGQSLRQVWSEILKIEIQDDTDFFATGAGSMDVVR